MIDDLDVENFSADEVEKGMDSTLVPAGFYTAILAGCADTQSKGGLAGTALVFEIDAGKYQGREIKETLWAASGKSEKGDQASNNRRLLFSHRLGLIEVDPKTKKYRKSEGKSSVYDCIGKRVIIEVINEEYESNGKKGKSAKLAFAGIFDLTDAKAVAKLASPAGQLPKPSATTSPKPTPKPKPAPKVEQPEIDTSDL